MRSIPRLDIKINQPIKLPMEKPLACIGDMRISCGIWYSPHGKTAYEFTYCEWCVDNGCVDKRNVYQVTSKTLKDDYLKSCLEQGTRPNEYHLSQIGKICNCNCDCPKKSSHAPIEKKTYCHDKCGEEINGKNPTLTMGRCLLCNNLIRKYHMKACDTCSMIYGICIGCGQK
jgi:hypothetical protein